MILSGLPPFLRNPHIQSVPASVKLRLPFVLLRAGRMLRHTRTHIPDCGKGVRPEGEYSAQSKGKKDLVILIHGWEGSSGSVYILSAAAYLFRQGFDIFRLNRGLFHSCRIDETVGAVKAVQATFPCGKLLSYGGHSGFIQKFGVPTYAEIRMAQLFQS